MSDRPDGTREDPGAADRPGGGGPGSVEEEAHRLVRAAADWWHAREEQAGRDATAGEDADVTGTAPPDQHDGTGPCTGCPWCRARTAFGPAGADALLGVADLLGSAADSLRAYARAQGARDRHDRASGPSGPSGPGGPDREQHPESGAGHGQEGERR